MTATSAWPSTRRCRSPARARRRTVAPWRTTGRSRGRAPRASSQAWRPARCSWRSAGPRRRPRPPPPGGGRTAAARPRRRATASRRASCRRGRRRAGGDASAPTAVPRRRAAAAGRRGALYRDRSAHRCRRGGTFIPGDGGAAVPPLLQAPATPLDRAAPARCCRTPAARPARSRRGAGGARAAAPCRAGRRSRGACTTPLIPRDAGTSAPPAPPPARRRAHVMPRRAVAPPAAAAPRRDRRPRDAPLAGAAAAPAPTPRRPPPTAARRAGDVRARRSRSRRRRAACSASPRRRSSRAISSPRCGWPTGAGRSSSRRPSRSRTPGSAACCCGSRSRFAIVAPLGWLFARRLVKPLDRLRRGRRAARPRSGRRDPARSTARPRSAAPPTPST